MKILVTGGAGFVGSALCRQFKLASANNTVVAFDNLRRRGSELNLAQFKKMGIQFVHGDIRTPADLDASGSGFDVCVEASAEPSVHAGQSGSTDYLVNTNLVGTYNALEFARRAVGQFIFLSTSRVYSIEPLRTLPLVANQTRFEFGDGVPEGRGVSAQGISEEFTVSQPRSLYGATKLGSELLIQEYAFSLGVNALINRCGVIAGPGQFGKTDQGVFTLWVANHHFNIALSYTGFGGTGLQVRDLLHPDDLFRLVQKQVESGSKYSGQTYNVGGGPGAGSVSLQELTTLCRAATGQQVAIGSTDVTAAVDVPWYVSDASRAKKDFSWKPQKSVEDIVRDIASWIKANENQLKDLF